MPRSALRRRHCRRAVPRFFFHTDSFDEEGKQGSRNVCAVAGRGVGVSTPLATLARRATDHCLFIRRHLLPDPPQPTRRWTNGGPARNRANAAVVCRKFLYHTPTNMVARGRLIPTSPIETRLPYGHVIYLLAGCSILPSSHGRDSDRGLLAQISDPKRCAGSGGAFCAMDDWVARAKLHRKPYPKLPTNIGPARPPQVPGNSRGRAAHACMCRCRHDFGRNGRNGLTKNRHASESRSGSCAPVIRMERIA